MTNFRKTLLTTALLACAVGTTTGAWAQSKKSDNFIGPAIGVSVAALQNKVALTSSVPSIDGQEVSANDSDASIIASWGFALSSEWVGTVGLSVGTKTTDLGTTTYTAGGTQTITGKAKDHIALSFAPGYRVGNDSLVYAKLSYHQFTSVYTDTASAGGSKTHSGTGFGIGYAYAATKNIELRGEYEAVTYSSETVNLTAGKPTQKALNLAVLYKF